MQSTKPSTHVNTWRPEINADELDELIDPTNKEEIEENIQKILGILAEGKKLRVQAYKFDPSKLKKEKLIKKAYKKINALKNQSAALVKENTKYKKEIKTWEKSLITPNLHGPIKKLYKRPEADKADTNPIPQHHEEFTSLHEMIWDLKNFNIKAEDSIKYLTKEIDSDTFKYDD